MKLTFLGVSSALSVGYKNFHSNMLIENDKSSLKLLIDCGGDVRHSLYELGYSAADIAAAYISHLHADHVGGLEWLAFSKFFGEQRQLPLYISVDQRKTLWAHVLSGGMSTLEESDSALETFFKLESIDNNKFTWSDRDFELIKVPHSYSNHQLLPSYGLFVIGPRLSIFITTDTRFAPDVLGEVYERADMIFQDCETSSHFSKQHAHYTQLRTLPLHIKQKMWLYDYNDACLPDAVSDGFRGFVTRGQIFDF